MCALSGDDPLRHGQPPEPEGTGDRLKVPQPAQAGTSFDTARPSRPGFFPRPDTRPPLPSNASPQPFPPWTSFACFCFCFWQDGHPISNYWGCSLSVCGMAWSSCHRHLLFSGCLEQCRLLWADESMPSCLQLPQPLDPRCMTECGLELERGHPRDTPACCVYVDGILAFRAFQSVRGVVAA